VAGVRVDFFRFDVNSSLAQNSGKLDDSTLSPKLNLVFGPWSETELFVNYGQGFHSNDARGTTITMDPKSGDPAQPVSPLVKTRGSEIGVRTEIIHGLQSSLALWQLNLDSELLFVGDAGSTQASRPSHRNGFEWSNHYVGRSGWLVDLQLAWSRSRFRDPAPEGNFIPGSIERVAALGVTYDPGGKWFASLQTRYFGPRPLIEDNSVTSRSTNLTNVRLGYRVDKTWQVRLDLLNIFNRKQSDIDYYYASCLRSELTGGTYANPACTGGAGSRTGLNDIHFHPVEPFAARVSVSASF
jgi:outer membrane receptor protein involved in Fe transport